MTVGATQGVKAWWAISLVVCLAALRDDAMNTTTVAVHDITDEHTKTQDTSREGETISALIDVLSSEDGLKRQAAREALVRIGEPAAAPLIEKLADPRHRVRWEAAKSLGEIGRPEAALPLVHALEDHDAVGRCPAAHGLISMKCIGLTPLLQTLVGRSDSAWLREGAHHMLHVLATGELEGVLRPVLAALEDIQPVLEAPIAAQTAGPLRVQPDHQRRLPRSKISGRRREPRRSP